MSVQLLLQLFRGEWALNIQSFNQYGVLIHQMLEGKDLDFTPNAFYKVFFDDKNTPYQHQTKERGVQIKTHSKALFRIDGEVVKASGLCTVGAVEMAAHIHAAATDSKIKGIVLETDTPGGQVTAAHPIITAINTAKKNNKPVIALVENALSLGYWMAAGCDYIYMKDDIAGMVGSVGVTATFPDITKHLEDKGIKLHTIVPEESKHKNEAFRLALEGKYDMIKKELMSPMAIKFQNHVKESRGAKLVQAEGVLTGKTFYTEQALEFGLIDKVGNLQDALNMIDIMHDINKMKN